VFNSGMYAVSAYAPGAGRVFLALGGHVGLPGRGFVPRDHRPVCRPLPPCTW